jgi:hypothetical protein
MAMNAVVLAQNFQASHKTNNYISLGAYANTALVRTRVPPDESGMVVVVGPSILHPCRILPRLQI